MLATNSSDHLPEEDLPLPSFAEVFGDGGLGNSLLKKRKKNSGNMGKLDSMNGEETTGRWTPDEHRLFLEGIMLYGKDWKKMQPLIKTRTLVQIRTHAQKVFKKIGLKKMNGLKRKDPADKDAGTTEGVGGRSVEKTGLATMNDIEDGDDLDDLDDEELANIGLSVSGVDETMLAAMSAEQQQQLAMQQQAVHSHFAQMGSNEGAYLQQGQAQQLQQQQWVQEQQQQQQHYQSQQLAQQQQQQQQQQQHHQQQPRDLSQMPPQAMTLESFQLQQLQQQSTQQQQAAQPQSVQQQQAAQQQSAQQQQLLQQQSVQPTVQGLQETSVGSGNGTAEYGQLNQHPPQTQPPLVPDQVLPPGATGIHVSAPASASASSSTPTSDMSGGPSGGLLSSLSSGLPQAQPLALALPPSSALQHQSPHQPQHQSPHQPQHQPQQLQQQLQQQTSPSQNHQQTNLPAGAAQSSFS
mmetsp:Transcript_27718/g.51765  ORF Transcript_27718/g.51765 Transcript_27718/m.51765 type:complete len:464 (+) Transcript_27718:171-1562(+)